MSQNKHSSSLFLDFSLFFCGLCNLASVSIKQENHNDVPHHYGKKLINACDLHRFIDERA